MYTPFYVLTIFYMTQLIEPTYIRIGYFSEFIISDSIDEFSFRVNRTTPVSYWFVNRFADSSTRS